MHLRSLDSWLRSVQLPSLLVTLVFLSSILMSLTKLKTIRLMEIAQTQREKDKPTVSIMTINKKTNGI